MPTLVILEYPTTGSRVEATRDADGTYTLELTSTLVSALRPRCGVPVPGVAAEQVLTVATELGER